MTDKQIKQDTFRKGGEPPLRAEKPPQPKPEPKVEPKPKAAPQSTTLKK